MHFPVWVLVKDSDDVKGEVDRLLAPYNEQSPENEVVDWESPGYRGKWDWYQIGGRWTGMLVRDYDPSSDPANIEVCTLCAGSGTRPDADRFDAAWMEWTKGCNGCMGKGTRVTWATNFKPFDRDVLPVPDIECEYVPYAIVTPDGEWHERTIKWPTKEEEPEVDREWRRRAVGIVTEHQEYVCVVVDCHS